MLMNGVYIKKETCVSPLSHHGRGRNPGGGKGGYPHGGVNQGGSLNGGYHGGGDLKITHGECCGKNAPGAIGGNPGGGKGGRDREGVGAAV